MTKRWGPTLKSELLKTKKLESKQQRATADKALRTELFQSPYWTAEQLVEAFEPEQD